MKFTKHLITTCLFISFLSCTEKKELPELPFSESNVIGEFNMLSVDEQIIATVITSDVEVEVSRTKSRADTFEINFILNDDGTYTVSGAYRKINTVTPTGQSSETTATIITLTDSGTFLVNEIENKITFTAKTKEFLDGTYLVSDFTEESFTLQKETITVQDQITATSDIEISFVRQ